MKTKTKVLACIVSVISVVALTLSVFALVTNHTSSVRVVKGECKTEIARATQNYASELLKTGTVTLDDEQLVALASSVSDIAMQEFDTELTEADIERLMNSINQAIDKQVEGYGIDLGETDKAYLREGVQTIVLSTIADNLQKNGSTSQETIDALKNAMNGKMDSVNAMLDTTGQDVLGQIVALEQLLDKASKTADDKSAYLKNLEDELKNLQDEMDRVDKTSNTDELVEAINIMQSEIIELQNVDKTDDKASVGTKDIEKLQKQLDALKVSASKNDTTSMKKSIEDATATLKKVVDNHTTEIASLSKTVSNSSNQLNTDVKALKDAQAKTEKLLASMSTSDVTEKMSKDIADINKKVEESITSLDEKIAEINSQFSTKLEEFQATMGELTEEQSQRLNEATENLSNAISSLDGSVRDEIAGLSDVDTELKALIEGSDADIQNLSALLEQAQSSIGSLNTEQGEQQTAIENLSSSISAMQTVLEESFGERLSAIEQAQTLMGETLTAVGEDISDANTEIASLKESLEATNEALTKKASTESLSALSDVVDTKATKDDLDGVKEDLNTSITSLGENVTKTQGDVDTLKNSVGALPQITYSEEEEGVPTLRITFPTDGE